MTQFKDPFSLSFLNPLQKTPFLHSCSTCFTLLWYLSQPTLPPWTGNSWQSVTELCKFSAKSSSWHTVSTQKCESEVTKSCPALCNPMDYSLPGSSVHGIPGKNTGVGCHWCFLNDWQLASYLFLLVCNLDMEDGSFLHIIQQWLREVDHLKEVLEPSCLGCLKNCCGRSSKVNVGLEGQGSWEWGQGRKNNQEMGRLGSRRPVIENSSR